MKVQFCFLAAALAYEQEWEEFQMKQGARNGEIPQAFKNTVDLVRAHNAKESTYKLTYTGPFAAMTPEEFKKLQGLRAASERQTAMPRQGVHENLGVSVDSVDWTTKGAVTPVKDQGQCGSCWSFSVTGTTEGQWALATNKLVSLSEQFFVDCAAPAGNHGCQGGFMDKTLGWGEDQWWPTEESYPYHAVQRQCIEGGWDVGISKGQVTGFKEVSDEKGLLDALANVGPISIGIEADQAAFQHYASGVITDGCDSVLDHGVLAVGYGSMDGTNYWKVKNSWGSSWGQDGYVYLQRDVNMCGIGTDMVTYPTVDPTVAPTPAPPAPPPAPPVYCPFDYESSSKCAWRCVSWCLNVSGGKGQFTPACTGDESKYHCECGQGDYCDSHNTVDTFTV
jgi:hypothetical protein